MKRVTPKTKVAPLTKEEKAKRAKARKDRAWREAAAKRVWYAERQAQLKSKPSSS